MAMVAYNKVLLSHALFNRDDIEVLNAESDNAGNLILEVSGPDLPECGFVTCNFNGINAPARFEER